jgi:hypothetical protein
MIFLCIVLCFGIYLLVRNELVYSERTRMNGVVYSQNDWEHYSSVRNLVSYEQMMWKFWVWPIGRMWPQELQQLKVNISNEKSGLH